MKRCIFGVVLLVCLLAGCLLGDRAASRDPQIIADAMTLAAESAFQGDREKTAALTRGARAVWEHSRDLQNLVRHEDQIRQIDVLFADLEALRGREAGWLFGALCLNLRLRAQALGDQDLLRCLRPGR